MDSGNNPNLKSKKRSKRKSSRGKRIISRGAKKQRNAPKKQRNQFKINEDEMHNIHQFSSLINNRVNREFLSKTARFQGEEQTPMEIMDFKKTFFKNKNNQNMQERKYVNAVTADNILDLNISLPISHNIINHYTRNTPMSSRNQSNGELMNQGMRIITERDVLERVNSLRRDINGQELREYPEDEIDMEEYQERHEEIIQSKRFNGNQSGLRSPGKGGTEKGIIKSIKTYSQMTNSLESSHGNLRADNVFYNNTSQHQSPNKSQKKRSFQKANNHLSFSNIVPITTNIPNQKPRSKKELKSIKQPNNMGKYFTKRRSPNRLAKDNTDTNMNTDIKNSRNHTRISNTNKQEKQHMNNKKMLDKIKIQKNQDLQTAPYQPMKKRTAKVSNRRKGFASGNNTNKSESQYHPKKKTKNRSGTNVDQEKTYKISGNVQSYLNSGSKIRNKKEISEIGVARKRKTGAGKRSSKQAQIEEEKQYNKFQSFAKNQIGKTILSFYLDKASRK